MGKAQIKKMQGMSQEDLTQLIEDADNLIEKEQAASAKRVEELEKLMEEAETQLSEKLAEIRGKGFNFAKTIRFEKFGVKYVPKKAPGDEDEEEEGGDDEEGGDEDEEE